MIIEINKEVENNMQHQIKLFQTKSNNFFIGRPSTELINHLKVEYYGSQTSLKNISNITVQNSSTLKVEVFNQNFVKVVEKGILQLNLGTVNTEKKIVRLFLPPVTKEYRLKILKMLKQDSENTKIQIRNIRKEAKNKIKTISKKNSFSEQDVQFTLTCIQKLTDESIKTIESFTLDKKNDIMKC